MKRRILVVDDDRMMVRTLCDVLRLQGWEAEGAFSGPEAIAAVRDGGYPLVLMDIKMPGMDGVAAFKAIKAHRPNVKVILMTAYTARDLIREAENEGVLRVLPKPVAPGPLLELLDSSLQGDQPFLIVDHDLPFLRSLADMLEARGYSAITAATLDEAESILEETKPAAVLLHLVLDGLDPPESVVAIHRVSPAVALILYSGRPSAIDEARADLPPNWVHAYLRKPFAVDRLTMLLDDLTGG